MLNIADEVLDTSNRFENKYLQKLADMSDLILLQETRIQHAYENSKEVVLFYLLFTKQY